MAAPRASATRGRCTSDRGGAGTISVVLAAALSGTAISRGASTHCEVSVPHESPLVVAYALAGRMDIDLTTESLGDDTTGEPVYLSQIWPTNDEIERLTTEHVVPAAFKRRYQEVFLGDRGGRSLTVPRQTFAWQPYSTYIANHHSLSISRSSTSVDSLYQARALLVLGDSSPPTISAPRVPSMKATQLAATHIPRHPPDDFNSYGSRRGNHEVMMRGNLRQYPYQAETLRTKEGGFTLKLPEGELMQVYDAAKTVCEEQTALVILAGKDMARARRGMGGERNRLARVRAVIAESFERIHRSNLVGMGVLPLVFSEGQSVQSLGSPAGNSSTWKFLSTSGPFKSSLCWRYHRLAPP